MSVRRGGLQSGSPGLRFAHPRSGDRGRTPGEGLGRRGAWYIVAKVDGFISVWVTDRDPRGDTLGHIITGNRAAQRYSNPDFVDPPISRSETVQAAGDPAGLAVAEECIRS